MNSAHDNPSFGTLFSTLTAFVSPAHQTVTRDDALYDKVSHLAIRFNRLVNLLHSWSERSRARRELRRLDDHLLDDVGLTREQLQAEIEKPFWRP